MPKPDHRLPPDPFIVQLPPHLIGPFRMMLLNNDSILVWVPDDKDSDVMPGEGPGMLHALTLEDYEKFIAKD